MKRISLWLLGLAWALGGLHELIATDTYLRLMPPWLLAPRAAVLASGTLKLLLVAMLFDRRTRRWGAWGFVVLLALMLPVNVYMAADTGAAVGIPAWVSWLRVPLQFAFMAWAYWHTRSDPAPRPADGAVLITGASTGIGEATALHLAARGFRVYAGVRDDIAGERLRAASGDQIVPVLLDVTRAEQIDEVRQRLDAELGDAGIVGLVNNAGVCVAAPLAVVPLDRLRHQIEVNLVGPIAVLQAFLPLLRRGRGRIVNIGSGIGRLALPFLGPYAVTKFALEGLSDTLRRELEADDVATSLIAVGSVDTPIWSKLLDGVRAIFAGASPEDRGRYEDRCLRVLSSSARDATRRTTRPEHVAWAVEAALVAPSPRSRYTVGSDVRLSWILGIVPDRVIDWAVRRAGRDAV